MSGDHAPIDSGFPRYDHYSTQERGDPRASVGWQTMVDRMLRLRAVTQITSLSKSTIYRFIDDGRFPKGVKLGERAVGWPEGEVRAWVQERINERGEVT